MNANGKRLNRRNVARRLGCSVCGAGLVALACQAPGDLERRTWDTGSDTATGKAVPEDRCVRYVDGTAEGSLTGLSWEDAFTTVQAGIDSAKTAWDAGGRAPDSSRCEVWVAGGTYNPTLKTNSETPASGAERQVTFSLREGVTLLGGFSGGESERLERDWRTHTTVLSGDLAGDEEPGFVNNSENAYHVVTGANEAVIDGFIISGGNSVGADLLEEGGGMYNNGVSPAVLNCTFENNSAAAGGGMMNRGASPSIIGCVFRDNAADYGGGMNNTEVSIPRVTNCIFADNSALSGGGMVNTHGSSALVTNSTFYNNTGSSDGGAIYNVSSHPVVSNTILWGNGAVPILNEMSTPEITHCNVEGAGYDGTDGNISVDPLLDSELLSLSVGSPCIDAGTLAALPRDVLDVDEDGVFSERIGRDLAGNRRLVGAGLDMGAVEHTTCPVRYVDAAATGVNNGTSWANAHPSLRDALSDAASSPASVCEIWVARGTYGASPDLTMSDTFHLVPTVGLYGGFDPAGGSDTFEQRDVAAHETVLTGYSSYLDMVGSVYHVVTGADNALIDGFTVREGLASGGLEHDNGGGMHNSGVSPTVSNCTFTSNSAVARGGGMYNSANGSPVVVDCVFDGNDATTGGGMANELSDPVVIGSTFQANSGGGVHNENSDIVLEDSLVRANQGGGMTSFQCSAITVTNSSFVDNYSGPGMHNEYTAGDITNGVFANNSGGGFDGGGMRNVNSFPRITNCTFVGNVSPGFGGGLYNDVASSPTVYNSIFWGNTAAIDGDQIYNEEVPTTTTVSNSDVQGGCSDTDNCTEFSIMLPQNIDADPLFVSNDIDDLDLRLTCPDPPGDCSPCIDAGENDQVSVFTDMAGNPRLVDGPNGPASARVDMGAYEYQ